VQKSFKKAMRKMFMKLTPGGSMDHRYALQLLFSENHKITNTSATTKTRGKIHIDLKSLE
jgi:hypothetical protein